jgi:hypothetical protein
MRKIDWNLTNFGNEDRSLSVGAVKEPPTIFTNSSPK